MIGHFALVHITKQLTILFMMSTDLIEILNFWNTFKCKALFCKDTWSVYEHHLPPEHPLGHHHHHRQHLLVGQI